MSELLKILRIVKWLSEADTSAATLQESLGVSIATLKRYIAEARHLGAKIVSVQSGKAWQYRLENADQVMPTLTKWIELEEKRSLV